MSAAWPIYNPALLPPERVALRYCLRQRLAERLLALLRRIGEHGAPQHQLVLGGPGAGKSMLLRALQSAILADEELAARWLPLTFAEAQWDVARPSDLWVNALDYLVVALGRATRRHAAASLEAALGQSISAEVAALPGDEDRRTREALALLSRASERLGRRFVLLVDTLDVVLERLKRDEWHVREVLASEPRLLVIGTSARAIEATYRYDAAFYDFFQLHELRPLERAALPELLATLHPEDPLVEVRRFAKRAPALADALLDLLGSQPRVLALLGQALAGAAADERAPHAAPAREDGPALLFAVLDALTPLLRARLEALAPQAQQVLVALAAAWHPARPQELAARTRLSANVISAQLHRLVQDGLADKTPLPPGGRQGFLVADRLLQVWLLMRMGQPHRRRLALALELLAAAHAGTLRGEVPRELGPPPQELDPADFLMRVAPELRALHEKLDDARRRVI